VATASRTWRRDDPRHQQIANDALLAVAGFLIGGYGVERYGEITIVHGAEPHGDMLIDDMASGIGLATERHPVTPEEWRSVGMKAGPLRNARMLDHPQGCTLVLGLRRGYHGSRGTTGCLDLARQRRIPILLFDYPEAL